MTIIHYIAAQFWGGGEQYVFDLSQTLATQGHRVVFIAQPHSEPIINERFAKIGPVYTLNPHTKNGKFSFITAYKLACIIRKEKANVLHIHDLKDLFVCAYAKHLVHRPINLVATNHLIRSSKRKCSWLWAYQQIDHFIFISQISLNTFMGNINIQKCRLAQKVIHNSVNIITDSSPSNLRQELLADPSETLFLYHGRICHEKGIVQLIKHLDPISHLPYRIVVAGKVAPEYEAEWQTLMANPNYNHKIVYLGFRTDIHTLIQQTDCGLCPSIVPEAGGPLSLLEHMALGSPIISSNNGSQPEYVSSYVDGILCEPEDYTQWQKAMQTMILEPRQRQKMGENARNHFQQQWSYPQFINQITNVYE